MEYYFILSGPAVPGNIGASARAMNTMGFSHLRLVNPADHLSTEARTLAHGSVHILEKAEVFSSFSEALSDIDFVIGTSARKKTSHYDYHRVELLPEMIRKKGSSIMNVAIAFGKEESGLSNEEMSRCDIISYVPMVAAYPSLNLSQAVMVYAYILSSLVIEPLSPHDIPKDKASYLALKKKMNRVLTLLDLGPGTIIYPRIMERIGLLGADDINLLHSFCNAFIEWEEKDPPRLKKQ